MPVSIYTPLVSPTFLQRFTASHTLSPIMKLFVTAPFLFLFGYALAAVPAAPVEARSAQLQGRTASGNSARSGHGTPYTGHVGGTGRITHGHYVRHHFHA